MTRDLTISSFSIRLHGRRSSYDDNDDKPSCESPTGSRYMDKSGMGPLILYPPSAARECQAPPCSPNQPIDDHDIGARELRTLTTLRTVPVLDVVVQHRVSPRRKGSLAREGSPAGDVYRRWPLPVSASSLQGPLPGLSARDWPAFPSIPCILPRGTDIEGFHPFAPQIIRICKMSIQGFSSVMRS